MPFYTSPSWQYGSELRGTVPESGVRVAEQHGHCLDGQSREILLACLLACLCSGCRTLFPVLRNGNNIADPSANIPGQGWLSQGRLWASGRLRVWASRMWIGNVGVAATRLEATFDPEKEDLIGDNVGVVTYGNYLDLPPQRGNNADIPANDSRHQTASLCAS